MDESQAVCDSVEAGPATAEGPPAARISAALRKRTRALHAEAERTGTIRALIRGRGTREGYAWLLTNLLPVYEEMEDALSRRRPADSVRLLALPCVYRSAAIRADLRLLTEPNWPRIRLLPAARRYARRVRAAGRGDGSLLVAHAYARYLGDLNGGRIMGRILADSLSLPPDALSFCNYPDIPDVATFIGQYRARIDRAGETLRNRPAVVEEAAKAFKCNIDLSKAIESRLTVRRASAPTGAR